MAQAMTALATLTLSTSQSTVTFSSISGAYKDLQLVTSVKDTAASSNFKINLNSDTTASYALTSLEGNGTSTSNGNSSPRTSIPISFTYATTGATNPNISITNIMDYSATDKHKQLLVRSSEASLATSLMLGIWWSTAAVTSILLTGGTAFAAGSTFTLYGVSA